MYDIINNIISHSWISQGANEQQYIYAACAVLVVVLTTVFIDLIYRTFQNFWQGKHK